VIEVVENLLLAMIIILSNHKTRGCNTPTGARHCEFDGVVEVEK